MVKAPRFLHGKTADLKTKKQIVNGEHDNPSIYEPNFPVFAKE